MSNNMLCRACLVSSESFQYYLFENVSSDMYSFCTSIKVTQEEQMPKSICNFCYDKLIKFNDFKNKCIQSHNSLLNNKWMQLEKNYVANANHSKIINNEENQHLMPKKEVIDRITTFDNFESKSTQHFEDSFEDSHHDFIDNSSDQDISTFAEPLKPSNKIKTRKRAKLKLPKVEQSFTCDICNRKFLSEKRLRTHVIKHTTKVAPLRCLPCNKKFVTQCGLKRHITTWHSRISLNSMKCRTCGKVARSQDSLRAHEKLHSNRQFHICNVCGKACSTAFCLKTHLETHQENRERQCTCEYCGKKFFTKKALSSHVSRCHTGRRYICQICNYPFTDKYNLAQHCRSLHEGKKFHKCKVCEKSFTTRFSYEEHQRIHSGERPFSCTYCPKSFLSKKRLIEHHRTHTGEKPHKCNVCTRGFTQRGTLKRHMKIHDKILPINEKYFEQRA